MANIDAFYFKRKDRAAALGLPQAVRDQIEADGVQHNTELIGQLGGMASAFEMLKNRLTAAQKSALDSEWTNNKAAIKARLDKAFQETLLEENLHSAEVAWILQDKTQAYTWMDSGIAFVLDQLKAKTQELATLRGQPDHGLAPDPVRAQWTFGKVVSVILEILLILVIALACVKVWILFTLLFLFVEELIKDMVDRSSCHGGTSTRRRAL